MGFDLDPLDDVLPEPAAVHARAGGKFQPKAKIRSRKGTSVLVQSTMSNATKEKVVRPTTTGSDMMQSLHSIDVATNGLNDTVGSSLAIPETCKSKDALKDYEGLHGGVPFTDERSLASVSSMSQVFAREEELGTTGATHLDSTPPCLGAISDANHHCHSSFGEKLKNYEGSPLGLQLTHESKSSFLLNPSSQFDAGDLCSTDVLPPNVSASDGNGDWISTFGKSVAEADTLGFDLEPFDDILPGHATSNVRVSSKFQPKAKPQPRKETSASLPSTLPYVTKEKPVTLASGTDAAQSIRPVNVVGGRLADSVCPSSSAGMLGPKVSLLEYEGSFSRVPLGNDDRSSVIVKPSAPLDAINVLHSEVAIADGNDDWSSSHGKSFGENADIFSGLEYLDDFLSRPAPGTETAATKPEPQVSMNALPGNTFLTSYRICTDAEGHFSPPEAQNLSDFNNRNVEEEPGDQAGEREADVDLAAEFYDPTPDQTYPIVSVTEDQVGDRNTDVYKNDEDFQIDVRRSQPEVVEAFSGLEALYNLPTSGQHRGENLSRSKLHADKDKTGFDVPYPDTVDSVSCLQEAHLLPSETGYINEDSIPSFTAGEVIDFSSVRFSDSASTDPPFELSMENENLAENANLGAAASGDVPPAGFSPKILESEDCQSSEIRKRKFSTRSGLSQKGLKSSTDCDKSDTVKSSRQLRKRMVTCKLVDESEDETHDNEGQPAEPPTDSIADEDRNNDDEYKVENSSQKKRAPRKSKKSNAENEKPVRKRKNTNETGETSTKESSRKFSHTTRRKRRCVDKTLLETPEDEIDPQKLPIRQLILLAEMRERMNKEISSSKAPLADQSADDSHLHEAFDNEWEPGATYQGRESYDDEEIRVQSSDHLVNYQSYMDKTPISRWSKSDTELFYEAVRQFGTDFSMIMQVFPGRSRNQIKLKYKMEERKHPLRLSDALKNRAKDHSHFELVIKQLKQIAAQEEQNSKQERSVDLTTVEGEEEEEVTLENNEGAIKSDQKEEDAIEEPAAEDKETDVAELGPEKSNESDDDMYRWSQYKSEL